MKIKLTAATKKRDDISTTNGSMQHEIKSLKSEVAQITSVKTKEVENLRQELEKVKKTLLDVTKKKDQILSEKGLFQNDMNEMSTLTGSTANAAGTPPASPVHAAPKAATVERSHALPQAPAQQLTPPATPPRSSVVVKPETTTAATSVIDPRRPAFDGDIPSVVTVQGFSHQGLTVEFKCTKADTWNNQKSTIIAKFTNTTTAPMHGLHLQVAVPKYVNMKMKSPTSTTIPIMGSNTKDVTQTIYITNTMIGTKNLMLKIRASFTSNGAKVEHVTTCSGFPAGQF